MSRVGAMKAKLAQKRLRAFALALPEAHEDFPWGERVAQVGKKVFAFFGHGDSVGVSVKLPQSLGQALACPFVEPTGYGLGAKGWVSASFETSDDVPIELLEGWVRESYLAVAPKKVARALTDAAAGAAPARSRAAPAKRAPRARARVPRSR
jgi:predicted DNA-binding protein (MmcQ/YjbR family)